MRSWHAKKLGTIAALASLTFALVLTAAGQAESTETGTVIEVFTPTSGYLVRDNLFDPTVVYYDDASPSLNLEAGSRVRFDVDSNYLARHLALIPRETGVIYDLYSASSGFVLRDAIVDPNIIWFDEAEAGGLALEIGTSVSFEVGSDDRASHLALASPPDTTAPTITFVGGSSYTVDQSVDITCAATDTQPAAPTCTVVGGEGPAYRFSVTNTAFGSATDDAGNTGTDQMEFTVIATYDSLCALSTQLVGPKSNTKLAAAASRELCEKLSQAQTAAGKGKPKEKAQKIVEYGKKLDALVKRGQITSTDAELAAAWAGTL